MKSVFKYSILAALPILFAAPELHADSSATSSVSAMIMTPLTLTPGGGGLSFGSIAPSSTAGTVTTTGGGHTTGGVTLFPGSSIASDSFTVTGMASTPYTVTVPTSTTISNTANNTMTVTYIGPTNPQTLNSTGHGGFGVDGTLAVSANQPAGTYSGTYTVSVSY